MEGMVQATLSVWWPVVHSLLFFFLQCWTSRLFFLQYLILQNQLPFRDKLEFNILQAKVHCQLMASVLYKLDRNRSNKASFRFKGRISARLRRAAKCPHKCGWSPCVSVHVCICVCPKPFGPMCVPPQHHTQNSWHSCRKKLQHSGNVHQPVRGIWWPNDQDTN